MSTDIIAIILASIALGWNIYRDVVNKPKLCVTMSKSSLLNREEADIIGDYLSIGAVNHGPGKIKIKMIVYQSNYWKFTFGNFKGGIIIHDNEIPYSGKLPADLEVTEEITLLFNWPPKFLSSEQTIARIGIIDSFDRKHWASKKDLNKVIADWKKENQDIEKET